MNLPDAVTNFAVYTASGLVLWLVADIAHTTRHIRRELREQRDRILVLETRCKQNHEG